MQNNIDLEKKEETQNDFIIHEVKSYDTIYGLSIEYQVSIQDIRNINGTSTDEIYQFKQIKIPLSKFPNTLFLLDNPNEIAVLNQQQIQYILIIYILYYFLIFIFIQVSYPEYIIYLRKIHYFASLMEGKDHGDFKVAKYYLECNDYNIEEAEFQYKDEIQFEKKYNKENKQIQMGLKYQKIE